MAEEIGTAPLLRKAIAKLREDYVGKIKKKSPYLIKTTVREVVGDKAIHDDLWHLADLELYVPVHVNALPDGPSRIDEPSALGGCSQVPGGIILESRLCL